jgi:hypothetical protein
MTVIDKNLPVISLRDIINRFEALNDISVATPVDNPEFTEVSNLLWHLGDKGKEIVWEGEGYPAIIINGDYFATCFRDMRKYNKRLSMADFRLVLFGPKAFWYRAAAA